MLQKEEPQLHAAAEIREADNKKIKPVSFDTGILQGCDYGERNKCKSN